MCDVISPSKGNTRNIKKLEERKTDPLSLEGYVSSTPLPKAPEKGRGGWLCRDLCHGCQSRCPGRTDLCLHSMLGPHREALFLAAGVPQRTPRVT